MEPNYMGVVGGVMFLLGSLFGYKILGERGATKEQMAVLLYDLNIIRNRVEEIRGKLSVKIPGNVKSKDKP